MLEIVSKEHYQAAQKLRSILAVYKEAEDLINIGAYVAGSNPGIDKAITMIGAVKSFLQQGVYESDDYDDTVKKLLNLMID